MPRPLLALATAALLGLAPSAVAGGTRRLELPPPRADQSAPPDGRRVARVVGNGAYEHLEALSGAPSDAALISDTLERIGFDVVFLTDVDQGTFEQALRTFQGRLRGASAGLVYYAGHGVEIAGVNYLLPVDLEPERVEDIVIGAVDAQDVEKALREAGVPVGVVMLDACRDNPFVGSTITLEDVGLADMKDVSVLFSFSAKPGMVALDEDRVYAGPLATHLAEPCQGIVKALTNVRDDVMRNTERRQEPWVSGVLSGLVYDFEAASCAPGAERAAADAAAPRSDAARAWPRLDIFGPRRGVVARTVTLSAQPAEAQASSDSLSTWWGASVAACAGEARDGTPVVYPRFGRRCPEGTTPDPLYEVDVVESAMGRSDFDPPVVGSYLVRAAPRAADGLLGPVSRRHLWVRPRHPVFVGVSLGGVGLPRDPLAAGSGRIGGADARVQAMVRVNQGAILGKSHEFLVGISGGALLADPLSPDGAGLFAALETADRFTGARGQSGLEVGLTLGAGTYGVSGGGGLTPVVPASLRVGPYLSLRKSYFDDGGEPCSGNLCGSAFLGPSVGAMYVPRASRLTFTPGVVFQYAINP